MKGNCENCARRATCQKAIGIIWGFCPDEFLPDDYAKRLKKARRLRTGACVVIYKNEIGKIRTANASKTAENIYYTIPRGAEILGYLQ